MAGQDIRQLLLQVDASVALAQRNLTSLARTVDRDTRQMEEGLQRPEDALANLERAFASIDQVVIASMNQQRAFGQVLDQVTAQEMRAVQAIGSLARATGQLSAPLQIATREQLQMAQAIGNFARGLNAADGPLGRFGRGTRGSGMAAVQASQQFQDFFIQVGSGQSVLVAGTQQLSQLAFVMQGAQGTAGKFAAFLSGPWGAAVFGGAAVLGLLVSAMGDSEEATDKTTRAKDLHRMSSAELAQAIREEAEAASDSIRTSRQAAEAALDAAEGKRKEAAERRRNIVTMLEEALEIERRGLAVDPMGGNVASGERARLEARLREAQAALSETETAVRSREIAIAQRDVAASLDAATAATERYEIALGRLNKRREEGRISDAAYRRELTIISRRRDAELEAARAAERRERSSRRSTAPTGRAITLAEAREIAERAGGRVTSTTRTRAEQQRLYDAYRRGEGPLAAPPGRSAHESGRALDIAGLSLAQAQAAYRGVVSPRSIIEEVNPRTGGRHVHVTLPRSPAREDNDRQAAAEERARAERARNAFAFAQDLARADEELLRARNELVSNSVAIAAFQIEQINMERARTEAAIQAEAIQGRYSQAQADQLKELNDRIATQRIANVRQREAERIEEERLEILDGDLQLEAEIERLRGRQAVTADERRASELRLLDLAREQERLELEGIIASRQSTDAQREIARRRLSQLATIANLERQGIDREYEGPRARYLRELREGTRNVSEQLEELEVRAMRELDDSTRSAIQSVLGLHGALGEIAADLIMIAVRQKLLLPLFDALLGGKGGGLLGSLFGSSATSRNAGADFVNSAAKFLPKFGGYKAGGGGVEAGKAYWVGERGKERFIPNVPGVIIPNDRGAGAGQVVVKLDYDRSVLRAEIVRTSGAVVAAEAPRIAAKGAGMAIKELTRPRM